MVIKNIQLNLTKQNHCLYNIAEKATHLPLHLYGFVKILGLKWTWMLNELVKVLLC